MYWVYPILAKLTWWQRILFIAGCTLFVLVLYALGGLIYRFWWTRARRRFYENGVTDVPTLVRLQENKLSMQ